MSGLCASNEVALAGHGMAGLATWMDGASALLVFAIAIGLCLLAGSALFEIWRIVASIWREVRAERARRWWR